jgi:hypothetical protein
MTPPDGTVNDPGPDEPPRGTEYPPLENSPRPADPYAPLDYPDTGTTPAYPAPGYQQPGYQQPGYPPPGYEQPGYPPPGYQQPGYQQPGYPPPPAGYPPQYPGGYSYGYDPYAAPRPQGTNGKAIAALVTSLVGLLFCGLPSIAGVILGFIAMREVKRTGQDGHGMALAGVIVGALAIIGWVLYLVVIFVMVIITEPSYSTSF